MKNTNLYAAFDQIITFSFYLLFFLVPLILTPFNYELFEYNKMMLIYGLTTIVVGSWIIKMILTKQVKIARTLLDLPIILFTLSQIISTIFSIDRHVSIWGYYSRFNGGLLSTFSYILLYYAFVSNFPKEKIKKLLLVVISSGVLVSVYGILEHFGIDKDLWVQDVQNRVFSTLGQPNWLAAYLAVLIPIGIALAISNIKNQKLIFFALTIFTLLSYICLIFTKSRSGFLGFWIGNGIFWLLLLLKYKRAIVKAIIIFNFSLLTLNFIFGAPFTQIDRFTLLQILAKAQNVQTQEVVKPPTTGSIIDVGITESGIIRRIVWEGAIEIFKHFPLFGSGVETFAFSYYLFRPIEHNMTSEWDFLYNKAHNEYLNFAATTGILGLGSYLLVIGGFAWWNFKKLKIKSAKLKVTRLDSAKRAIQNSKLLEDIKLKTLNSDFGLWTLDFGLFSAWLSILVTNFFGFSVVITQLFFFLIPAILFVLNNNISPVYLFSKEKTSKQLSINNYQLTISFFMLFTIFYLLFTILKLWYADTLFAQGYNLERIQQYSKSYKMISQAILFNKNEPFYYDELVIPAASLALQSHESQDSTASAQLIQQAIVSSNKALSISPNNVNFWKTRTRLFYLLAQLDEKYLTDALASLEQAKLLSPTDPKIRYNLGVLNLTLDQEEKAIEELKQASRLKPDYRDAFFAQGLYYEKERNLKQAKEAFEYILKYINPDDWEAKEKLEEIK